jgi:predicted unusual protein kinase regulating ubiquinone biosynthesis (AarF/ABC1/UbiB family)
LSQARGFIDGRFELKTEGRRDIASTIVLIDFGMVGRLSPTRRNQIVDLLAGFVGHDEEKMLEVLLDCARR